MNKEDLTKLCLLRRLITNTLYNVCSVHRGMWYIGGCGTSGDVVHRGDTMSTSEDIMSTSEMFSTMGDTMSTSGDIISTSGGYHDACGGYHEYIIHWGMFSTSGFSIEIERLLTTCSPTCIIISPDVLNIPRCTHDIPPMYHGITSMYSWYSPTYIMISPNVLMMSPVVLMVSSDAPYQSFT